MIFSQLQEDAYLTGTLVFEPRQTWLFVQNCRPLTQPTFITSIKHTVLTYVWNTVHKSDSCRVKKSKCILQFFQKYSFTVVHVPPRAQHVMLFRPCSAVAAIDQAILSYSLISMSSVLGQISLINSLFIPPKNKIRANFYLIKSQKE